ncbi:hypothetical protein K6119_04190 [Paracrocinitomix mangrovi]|uniref:hypothetical protein n=1 Tax=Paracrocinitomix mangrovi TaxID=2862509 RepID=UPI001C8EACA4|nr:hypothetical protein [Paracrocinitomix mangrovi]UKN02713.1 hypothetical protein K6119_04190 [Paracrocinitomix mangrovi]
MQLRLPIIIGLIINLNSQAQVNIELINGTWTFTDDNDSTWINFELDTLWMIQYPGICDSTLSEYAGYYTANYHPFGTVKFQFTICDYDQVTYISMSNGCIKSTGEIQSISQKKLEISWDGKVTTYYRKEE